MERRPSPHSWRVAEEKWDDEGDPPTVGHIPVLQPQGENGKRARCWEHLSNVVLVIDVRLHGQPA